MIRFPFLPVLVVAVFTGPALLAVTITVDSTEDLFAEDGQCTLREAVYASNNDTASGLTPGECPAGFGADVIVLQATGVYVLTTGSGGDLDILDDVEIQGAGADSSIIDANLVGRVFQMDADYWGNGTVEVTGVTVRGGSTSAVGGGIWVEYGCHLTLTDSVVTGNSTSNDGGGIRNDGIVTLANTRVSGNSASYGGGIYNDGTFTINSSNIEGNSALVDGGGIYNYWNSSLTLADGQIAGNLASRYGGGIFNDAALTLERSTLYENVAGSLGGGLFNDRTAIVNNSTLSGNSGTYGREIYNDSNASAAVRNTTFSETSVPGSGSSIQNWEAITFVNTIVQGTCGGGETPTSGGGNLESPGNTCGLIHPSDQRGVSPVDLNLGPLQDNEGPTLTHAPSPPSAAIDKALPGPCPATDQRGIDRPEDGDQSGTAECDVGAVEYVPCQLEPSITLSDQTVTSTVTFEACNEIWVGPNFYVALPADVTLRAGNRIVFDNEVEILEGTSCTVIIDPLLSVP
jgi:CSLREA domain-containing protein